MAGADDLRGELLGRALAAGARDLAVALHQLAEAVDVDRLPAFLGELHGELDREPERRRELEGLLAADRLVPGELVEDLLAARERLAEALLLEPNDALDLLGVLAQLGVGVAHLLDHDGREPVDALEPDALAVLDRAAKEAAADVGAALVSGRDAVGDQERDGAAVVGEHAVGLARRLALGVADGGLGLDPVHDDPEAVGVVVRGDALDDAGGALEPHPGVDVLCGQRDELVPGPQVELHEDEVVELVEAVAVAGLAAGLAAAVLLAAVEEDLRAGAARAGLGGLPEVVVAEPHDPLGRHSDALPGLDRDGVLVEAEERVPLVDGHPEPLGIELQVLRDELPRVVDGLVLEVVAEREVAHHLEEGVVAVGAPDVLEIGVLAAGAQAFLDAHGARAGRLLRPQEVRLERLHARDDEERRGVVGRRDQRMRGHTQMPALLVEALEAVAQLCRRPHADSVGRAPHDTTRVWCQNAASAAESGRVRSSHVWGLSPAMSRKAVVR